MSLTASSIALDTTGRILCPIACMVLRRTNNTPRGKKQSVLAHRFNSAPERIVSSEVTVIHRMIGLASRKVRAIDTRVCQHFSVALHDSPVFSGAVVLADESAAGASDRTKRNHDHFTDPAGCRVGCYERGAKTVDRSL